MPIEDTSARADLEAAFEKHAGQVEDTEVEVRPAAEAPVPEPEPVAGDDGRFDKSADPKDPTKVIVKDPVKESPDAARVPDPNAPEPIKAPVGWKPGAKGEWAKIPRAAQEEIARRETETAKVMSQTANARKHWDEFNQTVAPFMPLIRAQNSTPMAAFKNLMTTAAGLTVGNPEQKARIVAEMVQNFGIDIEILDKVLTGAVQQPRGPAPGTNPIEIAIQRQLAPVYDFMRNVQQTQTQRQQQLAEDADREVQAFAEKNEFFDDVRETVADLMEVSANRGRSMTMDQAYKIAIAQDPELSAAMQQRQQQQRSQQRGQQVVKARQAASSVSGNPTLNPVTAREPVNRRDDIAAAWDELSQN